MTTAPKKIRTEISVAMRPLRKLAKRMMRCLQNSTHPDKPFDLYYMGMSRKQAETLPHISDLLKPYTEVLERPKMEENPRTGVMEKVLERSGRPVMEKFTVKNLSRQERLSLLRPLTKAGLY